MRVLVIAPYAPDRDGIAAYTLQSVARLRREGNDVEVLSPSPSAAHHHLDMRAPRGALMLGRRARGYDRVIVQFHPDVFFRMPCTPARRAAVALALAAAWRNLGNVEVRVHEVDYRWGRGPGLTALAIRAMWRAAHRVSVHTERERLKFHDAFGVPLERIEVAAHGADFMPRTFMSQTEARTSLGLPIDAVIFVSIGFIQEHKGFDRAVRAFASLDAPRDSVRLHVVGSVRLEEPAQRAYLDELSTLVESTPGVHLHTEYVSDEVFDRWLVAADAVVLPYRRIWSSGVLERALLYARPVIASHVGGLPDQVRNGQVTLVKDDSELAAAMREHVRGGKRPSTPTAPSRPWPAPDTATRHNVMEEIRSRADAERGSSFAASTSQRNATSASRVGSRLRRVPRLDLPDATSSRPGVTLLKRAVQRLTAWQLLPIVQHINTMQRSMTESLDELNARVETGSDARSRSAKR